MAEQTYSWRVRGLGQPGRGGGGGRGSRAAGGGEEEEEEQVRVGGLGSGRGCTPPSSPPAGVVGARGGR